MLVPGVTDAIRESRGATVFVCSLADMQGETWGLSAREHYQALLNHGMDGLVDYMLVHSPDRVKPDKRLDRFFNAVHADVAAASEQVVCNHTGTHDTTVRPVALCYDDVEWIQKQGTVVLERDLVDPIHPTWHNTQALQEAFAGIVKLIKTR